MIDFCHFLIQLLENKYLAWSRDIRNMSKSWTTTAKTRTNIGRFVHLAVVMPLVHHFLSHLWELLVQAKRRNIKFSKENEDDLNLFLFCFEMARDGIDLKYMAYLKPTHAYQSDSFPIGLGGLHS